MFNWFKNNHKNYLPPDIERAFLTSKEVECKLGSTLTLPSDTVAYLSFKDKIYLSSNSFLEISAKNLQPLIEKQTKNEKKPIKTIKADLFFVGLKEQERNFSFRDKLMFNKEIIKTSINVYLSLKVKEPKRFLDSILSELALPNAQDSDELIFGYFEDFLHAFFLRKDLETDKIEGELYEDLFAKSKKFFSKIGIELSSLNISLNFEEDKKPKQTIKTSFFDDLPANSNENIAQNAISVDQNQNIEYNQEVKQKQTAPSESSSENAPAPKNCPYCGMKLIVGSKFCHRCGYKIS